MATVAEEIARAVESMDEEVRATYTEPQIEPGPEYRYTLRDFDRLECIFVHVPKAAGISVSVALFGHLGGGHRTVREYRRIFGWDFDRYFVFTVVRNPYRRLVSAWRFFNSERPVFRLAARYRDRELSGYQGFDDFVSRGLEDAAREVEEFRPQTHFVCADGGLDVDFTGRVETLNRDFDRICRELGVDAELPHRNRSRGERRPLSDWYTDREVVEVVRRVYARDFEVLGYEREVPPGCG